MTWHRPSPPDATWQVDAFSMLCTIFGTIALLESAFVIYIYNQEEDHIIPQSLTACLVNWRCVGLT
jgi:hypothetical protein